MLKQYNKNNNLEQVNFISQILKYSTLIFQYGTDLEKMELLDLLFKFTENSLTKQNKKENCQIILFPLNK